MMPWACYSIIYTDIDCIYALSVGIRYTLFCFLKNSLKAQVVFVILLFSYQFGRFLLSPSSVFLQGQVHLLEPVISWVHSLPRF